MSNSPSQLNQQWREITDPIQQRGIENSPIPGGSNYQQSQQSYSWTDGNTQGQHHQSHQSWSWSGTTCSPVPQTPSAFQPPQMLAMSPMQSSHHQIHQQMIQSAANHAQQAMAHHQQALNVHQNMSSFMSGAMTPMVQQTPVQSQITYQTASSQQQNTFQQNVLQAPQQQAQSKFQPMSPMAPGIPPVNQGGSHQQPPRNLMSTPVPIAAQPQLQIQQGIYQQSSPQGNTAWQQQQPQVQSLPNIQAQSAQPQLQLPSTEQSPQHDHRMEDAARLERQDRRFKDLERQRKDDLEKMNRAGADINTRLRDLEQSRVQSQRDKDTKDREVCRLQEKLTAVERQRREGAERNSEKLAELVRSQASSPTAATPAFDMSALQKVVRETRAQQLSVQGIERVIEEQVSKRLTGMATKADIRSAGGQMQNALSQVPAGLSQEQVQDAVNRELNNVMQDVANHVNQQRRLAEQEQTDPRSLSASQNRVQTDFVIEELPDEEAANASKPRSHRTRRGHRSQRTLPPAASHDFVSATGPLVIGQHPSPAAPQASSGPPGRPTGQTAQGAAPGKTQYAAKDAPPRPPNELESALALADRQTPRTTIPSNHTNAAQTQTRRTGSQLHSVPRSQLQIQEIPQAPGEGRGSQRPVRQLQQIDAGPSQRQLEAPPAFPQQTTAGGQQAIPRAPGAASNQRQLEAPPAPKGEAPSHDLVRQRRDVSKRAPGK